MGWSLEIGSASLTYVGRTNSAASSQDKTPGIGKAASVESRLGNGCVIPTIRACCPYVFWEKVRDYRCSSSLVSGDERSSNKVPLSLPIQTYVPPASKTSTEMDSSSVNRFATTFPAVPPVNWLSGKLTLWVHNIPPMTMKSKFVRGSCESEVYRAAEQEPANNRESMRNIWKEADGRP